MAIFKGACTALITPFLNDKVDYEALERLIENQLKGNIDAILINGTTGEPTTMTHKERTAVAKFAIEMVNKKVPIILGAGSNNTFTAIEYAIEAKELGADGILVVTPYYNKATQNGLIAHFKAIADAVDIPMIMYNVPGRTGVNMLPSTVEKLCGYKNIVAMKEASGNVEQIQELIRLTYGKMDVYSGDDGLILPVIACGGVGVISVASNIVPQYVVDLCKMVESNLTKAREMQFKINPLVKALFSEVNPIPIKTACKLLGFCDDYMRLPMTKMENIDTLRQAMINFGFKI